MPAKATAGALAGTDRTASPDTPSIDGFRDEIVARDGLPVEVDDSWRTRLAALRQTAGHLADQGRTDAETLLEMFLHPHHRTDTFEASAPVTELEMAQAYLMDEVLGRSPDYLCEPEQSETRIQAAMSGTFIGMVSGAVTLIIGIYVFASISSTMPTPENQQLADATNTTKSTTGQAFQLGAVAIIVMVAALILGLIGTFGGGGGMGGGGGRRRR